MDVEEIGKYIDIKRLVSTLSWKTKKNGWSPKHTQNSKFLKISNENKCSTELETMFGKKTKLTGVLW